MRLVIVTTAAIALLAVGSSASAAVNTPSVTTNSNHFGTAAADSPSEASYWLATADGGVFTFGEAPFYGSMGGRPLAAPVVGIAASPGDQGYWLVASDGGVFAFGDAGFFGSMAGRPLNAPIVQMAVTPTGQGYWPVGADGGVFAFGDARFYGSMAGRPLNEPIVSITSTTDGSGYYEAGGDGGVFAFGTATFYGSYVYYTTRLPQPQIIGLFLYPGPTRNVPGYISEWANGETQAYNETTPTPAPAEPTLPPSGLTESVVAFSWPYMATAKGQVLTLSSDTHPGLTALTLVAPVVGLQSFAEEQTRYPVTSVRTNP